MEANKNYKLKKMQGEQLSPEEAERLRKALFGSKEDYEREFGSSATSEFGTPAPQDWIHLKHKESGEWHMYLKSELDDPEFPRNEYE